MIFMRKYVTVPYIAAGFIEGSLDTGDLLRKGCDHIFWGILNIAIIRGQINIFSRNNIADLRCHPQFIVMLKDDLWIDLIVSVKGDFLPSKDLKVNQVQMNRVCITSEVVNFPYLGRT